MLGAASSCLMQQAATRALQAVLPGCSSAALSDLLSCRLRYASAAGIVPDEAVGAGGGGDSQQKAKEMQAQLEQYDPLRFSDAVSIVHKHGMALLFDPWYNKGAWLSWQYNACVGHLLLCSCHYG